MRTSLLTLATLIVVSATTATTAAADLWPLRKPSWRLSADPDENTRLVRAAAERGDPLYQYHYAKMLQEGRGVPQDMAAAEKWFLAAAGQGLANAQFHAGIFLERGLNGPRKGPEGLAWFEKAAAQGHGPAIRCAAAVNSLGDTVPKNPAKALHWNLKSAERGDPEATYFVATAYRDSKNAAKAREWMFKAANSGNSLAQASYAKMLADAPGATAADLTESIAWMRRSAEAGNNLGQLELGLLYAQGQGVPRDGTLALKYIRSTAWFYKSFAYYPIGLIYLEGNGVPKDELEGAAWLQLATLHNTDSSAKARIVLETRKLQVGKAAIEQRAAEIRENLRLEGMALFKTPTSPKGWQEVDVDGAGGFYLPPSLKIEAPEATPKSRGSLGDVLTITDRNAAVTIVPVKGTGIRIHLRTEIGAGEDYPGSHDAITFTPAELIELETTLTREVAATAADPGELEIFGTEPAKVVTLKKARRPALLLTCRRRAGAGKRQIVEQYRVPSTDRMRILTVIIDEDLPAARRAKLQQLLDNLRFNT